YDKNGKSIPAEKLGGLGGNLTAEEPYFPISKTILFFFNVFQIKLQYPEEFLVTVSGHYCPVVHGGSPVIRSLTFRSNKRTFGPFGIKEGTTFSFSMDGGLIMGFNGRSGWHLDAIGFRLSRVQTTKLFQRVQKSLRKLTSTASKSSAPKDGEIRSQT
ncbi:jacalin-related lectin 19, partial [Quercus suber]